MASLAEYYLDELYKWKSLIDSYVEEISLLQEKLKTLVNSDYTLLITDSAEHGLEQLAPFWQNLLHIRYAIGSFERKLYKDRVIIDNALVTDHIRRLHKQLRKDVKKTIEEFTEVKASCNTLLAHAAIHSR
jgi:hypothetical protein